MSQPSFLPKRDGLTMREIIALTGARQRPAVELERRITGIAALERAGPRDLCFLDRAELSEAATICDAGACLTSDDLAELLPERVVPLRVEAPYRAFVAVAVALFPDAVRPSSLFDSQGIAEGAVVHRSARLEAGVTIDPGVVVGPHAEIGTGTVIAAGAVIGPGVSIGRHCAIGPHASISHALIGDRVIIHAGCRIGQAGPDARSDPSGLIAAATANMSVPKIGRVIIQDDVEIGANATVDRGSFADTLIGEGAKIDNLVRIAQNAMVERRTMLAGKGL